MKSVSYYPVSMLYGEKTENRLVTSHLKSGSFTQFWRNGENYFEDKDQNILIEYCKMNI